MMFVCVQGRIQDFQGSARGWDLQVVFFGENKIVKMKLGPVGKGSQDLFVCRSATIYYFSFP